MSIRLEEVTEASRSYLPAAWYFIQACRSRPGDELAGVGKLGDYASQVQAERDWVRDCTAEASGRDLPEGRVPALQFYALDRDDDLVGMIQLRLGLNDYLLRNGGNIGYSVRPDRRRRGYASQMLAGCLVQARRRGLDRVLITCSPANEGSRRTIMAAGGVLEDVRENDEGRLTERYWIDL